MEPIKPHSDDDDDWYRNPRAVTIAKLDGSRLLLENDETGKITALERIMLHKNTKDLEGTVICVAGVFRSGKSFLLAHFQRDLQRNCTNPDKIRETLLSPRGAAEQLIECQGGSKSHTQGIVMWSRPIIAKRADGKELAVLLVDTQGAWDNKESQNATSKLFAFSALLSSVLINNLVKQITSVDWNHLKFFMQFTNDLVPAGSAFKVFQHLILLVRDWQNEDEGIGVDGGRSFIHDQFDDKATNPQLRDLFGFLRLHFGDKLQCCLLPTPGDKITEKNVEFSMLKPAFGAELSKFIYLLIATAEPKTLGDKPMTFAELHQLTTDCSAEFASDSELLDANTYSLSQNYFAGLRRKLFRDAVKLYNKKFNACIDKKFAYSDDELDNIRKLARTEAINEYEESCRKLPRMPTGTIKQEDEHSGMKELDKKIQQIFKCFKTTNEDLRRTETKNNDDLLERALKTYKVKFNEVFDKIEYQFSETQLTTVNAVAEAWAVFSASKGDQFLLGSDKTIADCNEKFKKLIEDANNTFLSDNKKRPEKSTLEWVVDNPVGKVVLASAALGAVAASVWFFRPSKQTAGAAAAAVGGAATGGHELMPNASKEVATIVDDWLDKQKKLFATQDVDQFYSENKHRMFKCRTPIATLFINIKLEDVCNKNKQ